MNQISHFFVAETRLENEQQAILELKGLLDLETKPCLGYLAFFSYNYDLAKIEEYLKSYLPYQKIVGCTTCGNISTTGYSDKSILLVGFCDESFQLLFEKIENLNTLPQAKVNDKILRIQDKFLKQFSSLENFSATFCLQLFDGLSKNEERVTHLMRENFGYDITLLGASAGDNLNFQDTKVLYKGKFVSNAVVLVFVQTKLLFQAFSLHHLEATENLLVVTKADHITRRVYELNGLPAAEAYSQAIGYEVDQTSKSEVFALNPLVVEINGQAYPRSIQKCLSDKSLLFYSAIDIGVILRVAHRKNLYDETKNFLASLKGQFAKDYFILGFDCILRKLEANNLDLIPKMEALFANNTIHGFCTYGEQYNASHRNQTFTAIALADIDARIE